VMNTCQAHRSHKRAKISRRTASKRASHTHTHTQMANADEKRLKSEEVHAHTHTDTHTHTHTHAYTRHGSLSNSIVHEQTNEDAKSHLLALHIVLRFFFRTHQRRNGSKRKQQRRLGSKKQQQRRNGSKSRQRHSKKRPRERSLFTISICSPFTQARRSLQNPAQELEAVMNTSRWLDSQRGCELSSTQITQTAKPPRELVWLKTSEAQSEVPALLMVPE
jgi:hypothetical protein